MVKTSLLFFVFSLSLAAISLYFGRQVVSNELKLTENEAGCIKGTKIWSYLCIIGFLSISALFIIFRPVRWERYIFLFYVFLYSAVIGLVDLFSHNYYLEMLPGLLLFIPIGIITWGATGCLFGLLAGICIGIIMALTEWLFFRKISYGGGDTVYGAAAGALVGYSNINLYWELFILILIIAGAVHIVYIRLLRKQTLEENKFVPLLPWLSILTTTLYGYFVVNGL